MKGGFKPGLPVSILLHLERVQQYNSITFRDEQLPDKKFLKNSLYWSNISLGVIDLSF